MALSPGRRTFQAKPVSSIARITSQLKSNCHQASPWRAEVGKAWCELCQPSPRPNNPHSQLFRESSPTSYSLRPKTWQIELIDQVMWCVMKIRTRPPQTRPSSAPSHDQVTRPPISVGTLRLTITQM